MSQDQSWKTRVLIAGGIVGALLGLGAGFLYVRVAEESGGPKKVSTGEAVKLAIAALGVVRQVSQLGR
jgi:hypothetical protein